MFRSDSHRDVLGRRRGAAAVAGMVAAAALWLVIPATPVAAQPQPLPPPVTFEYTADAQTWIVPDGVTEATFDVYGAAGGDITGGSNEFKGGRGGRASATLPVMPGTTVTILVGGAGRSVDTCQVGQVPGGFNGGGEGGNGVCIGASGGGASDVRIGGTTLPDRVVVAGGGGGISTGQSEGCFHAGGPGGGLTGGSGACGGAAGGNQDGTSGSGVLGEGGAGTFGFLGGGGGGGGYYGGAGGAGGPGEHSFGGGGGSGFGPPGVVFETGVRSEDGLVIVTPHTGPPPECVQVGTTALATEWSALGGPYRPDPSVLTKCNVVFAVGETGQPYVHERVGDAWSAAMPLGGLLESVVAPAEQLVGPQDPNFEIFGNGVDGAVWYRTHQTGWESLGGALVSNPTAVIFEGQTYVFGVGLDDAVWYRTPHTDWASLGGAIISDLGVTTDGVNLYVTGVGLDDGVWAQHMSGGTWQGWSSLGGQVASAPVTTYAAGTGYLFVVGGDGAVWYQGVTGGTWSGWYGLGGVALSAPGAVAHQDGGIDVFVVGQDLAMWSQHWSGSQWSGWQDQGGGFTSNPAVSTTDVFGLGLDDLLYAGPIPA